MLYIFAALFVAAGCSSDSSETATPRPSSTVDRAPAEAAASQTPEPSTSVGITGSWLTEVDGALLQFRLDRTPDGQLLGFFDSISEGATDLSVVVGVDGDVVTLVIVDFGVVFEGTIEGDRLDGVWQQAGQEVPLIFERRAEPVLLSRPQQPELPFPYRAADVQFRNGTLTLAGTLVTPDGVGPFPAAVLISGSGAQDRDESIAGHKPFLVLADALARRGIATLRFDDRGIGGSTFGPRGATTADLATDARAAVDFLREQPDIGSIGLIGHSEGGLMAPLVALDSPDVAFIVSLAGPGLSGAEVLLTQTEDLMRAEGVSESDIAWRLEWNDDVIASAASDVSDAELADDVRTRLRNAAPTAPEALSILVSADGIEDVVDRFTDPWMRHFLKYDPAPDLQRLEIPVLAIIGDLDWQVAAATNIPALEAALSSNADATILALPGLNHLFQNATTGAISEYARLEETFDPETLMLIADWILARSKPA
jgi:hypothetical protein